MERQSMPKIKKIIPAKRPKELSAEEAKKLYDQENAASTSTSQTPEEPSSAASNHLDTQEKEIAVTNTNAVATPTQSTTVDTALNHTQPPIIAESASTTAKVPFYTHFGLSSIAVGAGVTTAIYFMNKSKSVEPNHPASVNGEKTLRVVEDSSDTSNTVWTVVDADKQQNQLVTGVFQGQYGTLTVSADGNLQYKLSTPGQTLQTLAANEQWVDTFNVKTADGTSTLLTVNIVGQNDAAVIGGDTAANLFENTTTPINGQLTINDVDKGQNSFIASSVTTPYGVLNIDTQGRWTYQLLQSNNLMLNSLSAGATITDTVLIQSIDGTEKAIQLHIAGENDPALIGGQTTFTTHEDLLNNSVAGQLTLTDIDLGETAFTPAVITGAYGTLTFSASGAYQYQLLNNGEALQSLSVSQSAVDTLPIRSQDGTQQTVQATIQGINDQPKAIDDTYNVYLYGEQFNVTNRAQWVDAIPNINQQALVNNLGGVAGFGEQVLSNDAYYSTSELIDISAVFPSGINIEGTLYKSLYVDDQGTVYTPDYNHRFFIKTSANYYTYQGAQTPTAGGNSTGSNRTYVDLDTITNTITFTWDDMHSWYDGKKPADAFQLQIIRDHTNDYKLVYRVEDINTPTSYLNVGWSSYQTNSPYYYMKTTYLATNKKEGEPLENSIGNTAYQGVWTARSTQGVLSDEHILSYIFSPLENDTDPEQHALTLTRATLLEGEGLVEVDNNQIRYLPADDMPSGLSQVKIEYTVQDALGAQSIGVSTLVIENAPNTAPISYTYPNFYGYEDRAYTFSLNDFRYNDAEGDALSHVIIDSLPNKGTLALNGNPVLLGQSIPADQLQQLTFLGLPNESGYSYSSFNFRLQDDGGTSLNGQDTSLPQTMSINLYNIPDAPASTNFSLDVNHNNVYYFKRWDFPFTDIDGDPLSSVIIESLPTVGILRVYDPYQSNDTPVFAGQSIPSFYLSFYSNDYSNNNNDYNFSYTPPADTAITETSFTYRVRDYGNTYNGGEALSDIYTATLHLI